MTMDAGRVGRSGLEDIAEDTTTFYSQDVQCFSLKKVPEVVDGNWMRLVADSGRMWVHAKGYGEGGENTLHRHLDEDHLFFVVSGAACFTLRDGVTVAVGPLEGIFIPTGALYRFRAQPGETLWMVRVGSGGDPTKPRVAGLPAAREDADVEKQALWDLQVEPKGLAGS